ncbi:MAG TPA: efflux RND transporter permease subunit [Blastocatellia bacterium]|nr:efflux RND transporter permease subunit [Blastocatellia bacterium]
MSRLVVSHPRLIIVVVVLLTVVFAFGLRKGMTLDVSPLSFVAENSQERRDFAEARKHFGADDYLLIAVVCDDVFAADNLARLKKLHEQIERVKGVNEVLSLVNVPYARSQSDGVSLEKLIPTSLNDKTRLEEARHVATTDRMFAGNLVSPDSRTAALNVLLKSELPTDKRHEITNAIYGLTRASGFKESYFAGDPFSQLRSTEALKKDLVLLLPLTVLFIVVLLWLCFRSLTAVWLPLVTIGIGLVWLMGLMAYFGTHFTILVLMLPTVMLAIGCSYMIHVLNQIGIANLAADQAECTQQDAIEKAMSFINLPVLVSALTIIAGFLSLTFTEIRAIRASAIYSAIGATLTMILSLTFIPAVLTVLPSRKLCFQVELTGRLVKLLEDTGRWATSRQKMLFFVTIAIVMVSLIGMRRINVDIDFFHFTKPGTETTVGFAEINRRLSGVVTFDIIVEGKEAGAIEKSEVLERISQLQAFAEQRKNGTGQGIDRSLSVADVVKHLNRAFNGNDPQQYRIPTDEKVISDLFADRDQLKGFLTEDGRVARVLIRSTLSGSQAMAQVVREVEQKGKELLPGLRVYATGTFVLLNRTSDQIGHEQMLSIGIALVTIFLMLAILFRSLRVGLTALVPNLVPIVFFFGFMGWRGIKLNLTTSLVASIVLGLAVDNAVQFIVRFRRVQKEDAPLRDAIIESMRLSGRPIIYANIALAATFAVFAISNFQPISDFGLLSAVTIFGCLVEDLVLLPSRLTSPIFRAK